MDEEFTVKIVMRISTGKAFDMPKDVALSVSEAVYRANLYKIKNPTATYFVVNNRNGDIEYWV